MRFALPLIRHDHGAEYWSARDLQGLLGYSEWRNFSDAIKRARISCEGSGNKPGYHFGDVNKMIGLGKGGQREIEDVHLSRFAMITSRRWPTRNLPYKYPHPSRMHMDYIDALSTAQKF